MAKFLVASDFHGSVIALQKTLDLFKAHQADKLIILGDTFGTDADKMVEMLNQVANRLTIVKGNNDWYFEPENAKFKLFNETYENINGKIAYLCHGHKLNDMYLEGYGAKIVMIGHTHRPILQKNGDIIFMCPGSMARPRYGTDKCYALIDENSIKILTENDEIYDEMSY